MLYCQDKIISLINWLVGIMCHDVFCRGSQCGFNQSSVFIFPFFFSLVAVPGDIWFRRHVFLLVRAFYGFGVITY